MRLLRRISRTSLLALLLVATVGFAPQPEVAVSQQAALIIVEPNEIRNTTLTIGSTFHVDVSAKNVTDLFGWGIVLKYDTAAISTSREAVTFGPLWAEQTQTGNGAGFITVDDSGGNVTAAFTLLGAQPGISGSFPLFGVTLTVDANNIESVIDIDETRTQLARFVGGEVVFIPYVADDGFFSNVPRTRVSVEPGVVAGVPPGSSFKFDVVVKEVTDLAGFQVNVTYNTAVLTASQISFGPFFASQIPACGFGSLPSSDDTGKIVGFLTLFGPPCPTFTGTTPLITGNFTVDTIGQTAIRIEPETLLANTLGQQISYAPDHSFFTNEAPVFDFSVSVTPSLGNIVTSGMINATVSVTSLSGAPEPVSLTANGQPQGSTVTFTSTSGTPTFQSAMLVNVPLGTPTGTYDIIIRGTSSTGLVRTAIFRLIVQRGEPPPPTQLPRWVLKSPIPTAREGYGAAAVDGTIYYIAGYHAGDTAINEAYDTATNTWSFKASLPDDPRSETVAVTDGVYVYLIGGRPVSLVGNDLWRYDPRSNSWTSLRPMPTARATEHVAVFHNGRVFVIGGRTFDAPGGGAISSVEIYDVVSDNWTAGSPLPEPRADFGAVILNDKIYVIGGIDDAGTVQNTVFIYDIATNAWSSGSPMPQGRASYAAGVCGSQIFVIAGIDSGFLLQNSNYAYDPGSDSWTVSVPIPNPTAEAQGASLPGGIYVVSGGIFGSGSFNQANYLFECLEARVYVSPSHQPVQPVGTVIIYQVKVEKMNPFDSWDMFVRVNNTVLTPISVSISGNLLSANFSAVVIELANCVEGVGFGCTALDGPGVIHSAVTVSGTVNMTSPASGLLFTITYRVQGIEPFSKVDIFSDIIQRQGSLVEHTTQDGIYGTPPPPPFDFAISVSPSSSIVTPGGSTNASIAITLIQGTPEPVTLSTVLAPSGIIVVLSPVIGTPSFTSMMTITTSPTTPIGSFPITITGTSVGGLVRSTIFTLTVQVANQPPVAVATFSPPNPVVGQPVFFDGSGSFDPDGFIVEWQWDFGDGFIGFGTFTSHIYNSPGSYLVTLTVRDNLNAIGITSRVVLVSPTVAHDVAIEFVDVPLTEAVSGQFVPIGVALRNKGSSFEFVDLTVFFDSTTIEVRTGIELAPGGFAFIAVLWDTFGVQPGTYLITATVFLATDEFPGDNTFIDGTVTILPPPTLTVTPRSGSLGTKVMVQGSGFPSPPFEGPSIDLVTVSFDDMFMGLAIARGGQFTFVFNVPHAEPGMHQVKAFSVLSGARATVPFEVLPDAALGIEAVLEVTVDVGAVYFPGDTADIYVLVTSAGSPVDPDAPIDLQLELVLIAPDGSRTILNANSLGPGLFKASHPIPRKDSLGTYAILATAHHEGLDGSTIRSFEVKPTWISREGPRIAAATATIGGIGAVVALAWRKGYLRRRNEEEPSPFS